MRMRNLLVFILLFFLWMTSHAQLREFYKKEGKINAAGGTNFYQIDLVFKADSTFTRESRVYIPSPNTEPILVEVSTGSWYQKADTLIMNFKGESTDEELIDRYLIRRKKLKRLLDGERTVYKGHGKPLHYQK